MNKDKNVLIVFDDMMADMKASKKLSPIFSELFITDKKLNVSLVFILQSYFKMPKDIIRMATLYLIMKIYNKKEFV